MEKVANSSSMIQPEIQFLRALAVSLVILSHSKFAMWLGGFVGVDMFFVVSGYVIGLSLIHERQRSNSNSLQRFFQRRFFRIFPPLVATIVGSCVYAYLILPLDRVQDYFIQQARAALFSYANFFFIFHKMDYFLQEANSTPKRLTSTWQQAEVLVVCGNQTQPSSSSTRQPAAIWRGC